MEFWGAEVKVGESVKVDPQEFEACIHLSQAALGESKKDKANESVVIYLKVGDQKLVLGTLNREKIPQTTLELVLDKEFELSHSSKTSSVHFCGYKAYYPDNDSEGEDDFSDSDEEEIPLAQPIENGKPETKAADQVVSEAKKAPAKSGASAKQVKVVDPKEENDDDSDDESDDDLDSSDEEMGDADSEDEDESDEEETPVKKVDQGKKRANESASKTPVPSKKSKNSTPEKTDGKKAVHTATPHPKKGGKTPGSEAKSPKSGGQLSCSSCSKTFNSETGLSQHSKAKHGAQ
ncbi:histone deacetylase HDT1-like [Vicia villosa]|uniref:histone deacetylase HDT1-like n=1 Tax=Vicia villosa TaxID=3911 RepID=UPI00273B9290|nr:histone deacetylase HDT1-like [Vicia villosa]